VKIQKNTTNKRPNKKIKKVGNPFDGKAEEAIISKLVI
jgi:hypothetical protein